MREHTGAELVRLAEERAPQVAIAFQEWRAALAAIESAGKLAEPKLTLGAYLAAVETRTGPMEGRASLVQELPRVGARRLERELASAQAEVAHQRFLDARLAVRLTAVEVWLELVDLGLSLDVTRAHLELVSHWEAVARSRFEANLVDSPDLLRVEMEVARLGNEQVSLDAQYGRLWARMGAVLDLDLAAVEGLKPGLEGLSLIDDLWGGELEIAREALARGNPLGQAAGAEFLGAELRAQLATKSRAPRFSVGLDYIAIGERSVSRGGDDALALSVGVHVPIWRSAYRADRSGARARVRAARLRQIALRRQQTAELESLLFELADRERFESLLTSVLIPKAEQSMLALDRAYQVGSVGYLELIDAERVLFTSQLEVGHARTQGALAKARIARLIGSGIEVTQ